MPNNYNSSFTGQHNDEYDTRIAQLNNQIITLQNRITELENPPLIYVGSQVLIERYDLSVTQSVGKTGLAGCGGYDLFLGLFTGRDVPNGYVKGYRLSATVRTSGNCPVTLYLNNFATQATNTWSDVYYLRTCSTTIFKESDIVLANNVIYNYSNHNGCYLYYSVDYTSGGAINIRGITIHGYFIKV